MNYRRILCALGGLLLIGSACTQFEGETDEETRADRRRYERADSTDGLRDRVCHTTATDEQGNDGTSGDQTHAHSTAPFTRSETISVPDDAACVVVRGHDQTHGYGGQALLVTVPGGPDSRGRPSLVRAA